MNDIDPAPGSEHQAPQIDPREAPVTPRGAPVGGMLSAAAGGMGRAALQRRINRRAAERDADLHAHADAGVAGAGGALPHHEQIQSSFGKHDVSGVQAHVGGAAAKASEAIGASAYATGNHVAFAGSPDLHTAAHEAAHVVQQRGGVHLKGGVGEEGDTYERHADAVADLVVQGKSAESLLGEHAPSGGGGGVQRKALQRNPPATGPTPAPPGPAVHPVAPAVVAPVHPPVAAADPHKTALHNFFKTAGPKIKGAKDFNAIADAIHPGVALYDADPASRAAKDTPQEIHQRYANVHRGIERAHAFFKAQLTKTGDMKWAVAERKFVTERLALALPDQANTLGDKMIAEGAKPEADVAATNVHLSNNAWDGLMKNAKTILAAENVDATDSHTSGTHVKAEGGLAKVFSVKQIWDKMKPDLKNLWLTVYTDPKVALTKFLEQCKVAGTIVTKPLGADIAAKGDPTLAPRFNAWASVAAGFDGGVTGFCGMANDYALHDKKFDTLKVALALNEDNYPGKVGIVCKIPSSQLDAATAKAKTGGATDENVLGKPSVFNSLMFSEFNYVVEDRALGKTGGDGKNGGVADPNGKHEVTVCNIPISAFLSGGFEIFA